MSRFLSNLIRRTTSPSETLQPRVGSLFEPAGSGHTMAEVNPGEFTQDRSLKPTSDSSSDAPAPFVSQAPARAETVPQGQPFGELGTAPQPAQGILRPRKGSSQEEIPSPVLAPSRTSSRQSQEDYPDREATHNSRDELFEASRENFAVERKVVDRRQLISEIHDEPRTASGTVVASQRRESPDSIHAGQARGSDGSRTVISPAVLQARPLASPFVKALPQSDASAPSTTVKVTIGRIEVKAVMQRPAEVLKPAKPVTRMSLDDYLQSRGKRSQ